MSEYTFTQPTDAPPYFTVFTDELTGFLQLLCTKIDNFEKKMDAIQTTLRADIRAATNKATQALDLALANEGSIKALKGDLFSMQRKCFGLTEENARLTNHINDLESYGRRENLVIRGIPEQIDEDENKCVAAVKRSFIEKVGINADVVNKMVFQRCHRLGDIDEKSRPNNSYTRPIIVRFLDFNARKLIWGQRFDITDSKYSLSENYANRVENKRRLLYPIMKQAKKSKKYQKVFIRGDTLYLDRKQYRVDDNLDELPTELHPKQFSSRSNSDWIIFGGIHSVYNYMSNYYPHKVTHSDIDHPTAEHAYQYAKATHFNDIQSANKILGALTPAAAKVFGNQVKGFNATVWNGEKEKTMLSIVRNKFSDNSELAGLLKETEGKSLAEAGKSKSFAIGMSLNDPNLFNTSKWPQNCNILGRCLMEIRNEL